MVGRIEGFEAREKIYRATISYPVEAFSDLSQLLNVLFGNSSIKPGIRVEGLQLPPGVLVGFRGPRFGIQGLRQKLGIAQRPLLCTALKPMGLSARELAALAYRLALGGIDLIKDDHGLSNQSFSPFAERLERCLEAVERANQESGMGCVYVPNLSADGSQTLENARFARKAGAGAIMISPGLTGFGLLQQIASDDAIALPVLAHPAFLGSFVTASDAGISHRVLFGTLMRLAGADASIFPHTGGRFAFSLQDCQQLAQGCLEALGPIKPIFPVPAGGLSVSRVPELLQTYGNQVIFLIGGGLHKHGPDLVENAKYFRKLVE
jgi:ribulose-bisphosphate carboxylase large chain